MFEKYNLTKPDNLVDLFEQSVKMYPDRPCLGTKNRDGEYEWITYREMGRRIDNLRGGLAAMGLKKGDAVGIIANNCVDWAVGHFAVAGIITGKLCQGCFGTLIIQALYLRVSKHAADQQIIG